MSTPEKPVGDAARQTADAGQPPLQQRTTSHGGVQGQAAADEPDAKLPHERDQSPGDAGDAPRDEGQKAYEDAQRGLPDTSRGEATDAAYHALRQKKP